MARINGTRTGQTTELPDVPRELWHRRVRAGISLPIVVDNQGSIVIAATTAELVQVSPQGEEQWHRNLGMSVPNAGPVLMSDGTRAILTASGELWGFQSDGTLKFHSDLSAFGTDPRVAPLPRDNGSLALVIGRTIVVVDSNGSVLDQVDAGERLLGSLLETSEGILAIGESGRVLRWASPLPPSTVGTFKGMVREGAAMIDPHTLVAVVDLQRVLQLDLQTGTTSLRLNLFGIDAPPAVGPQSIVYVTTASGMLYGLSPAGESLRVSLLPTDTSSGDAGVTIRAYADANPPLVVDRTGRIAFARSDGQVGIVSPRGRVFVSDRRACNDPQSLVPAGQSRFVVGCRNGTLRMYGP